jgi:hypothetical protein
MNIVEIEVPFKMEVKTYSCKKHYEKLLLHSFATWKITDPLRYDMDITSVHKKSSCILNSFDATLISLSRTIINTYYHSMPSLTFGLKGYGSYSC